MAFHASRLGISATIVMPQTTPLVKVENTRQLGARVVLSARRSPTVPKKRRGWRRPAEGYLLVHPYDDRHVMAGQGTIALKCSPMRRTSRCWWCRSAAAGSFRHRGGAKALKPDIEIIGVEGGALPLLQQRPERVGASDRRADLADGIAVKTIGTLTLPVIRALVSE